MKAVILFFVFGICFAQTNFPDTLYLYNSTILPCLITEYSNSRIYFNLSNNHKESIISAAIDKCIVEEFGKVYNREEGLIVDEEMLEDFIDLRNEKLYLQYEIEKLVKISKLEASINEPDSVYLIKKNFSKEIANWGFGFLIVPYYAKNVYHIENNSFINTPIVNSSIEKEINLISSISYSLRSNLRVVLEVSYSSNTSEDKREIYRSYSTSNNYETIDKNKLQIFNFVLGFKYYFNNFISKRVQYYCEIGFGKQFGTFQDDFYNSSYIPPTDITQSDNIEKFIEELNSPFYFQIGFGTEYYFNPSISINTNFKLIYSQIDAQHKTRLIAENNSETNERNYSFDNFITRVGLGLNFYF